MTAREVLVAILHTLVCSDDELEAVATTELLNAVRPILANVAASPALLVRMNSNDSVVLRSPRRKQHSVRGRRAAKLQPWSAALDAAVCTALKRFLIPPSGRSRGYPTRSASSRFAPHRVPTAAGFAGSAQPTERPRNRAATTVPVARPIHVGSSNIDVSDSHITAARTLDEFVNGR